MKNYDISTVSTTVSKFVNRLIEKKLNAISLLGQYRAHGQLKLSIQEKCVVFVIATITRNAIVQAFSQVPL